MQNQFAVRVGCIFDLEMMRFLVMHTKAAQLGWHICDLFVSLVALHVNFKVTLHSIIYLHSIVQ